MRKLPILSILCLLTSWLALFVSAQGYSELVFSGFVEPSTTDESIDFSNVQIQLLSDDGKFIDRTHCSSNGFFLLPIYDKKSYVVTVKPPQESTFEPPSISVDLRGKSNEEVKHITEQSLTFKFLGFSLTGQVQIRGSTTGAVGVKVALINANNQKVGETTTTEGGNFRFDRVMTGKYRAQLETKDTGFYYHDGEGAIECELSWKKGQECTGNLVISSFEVKGSVSNQNDLLGRHIIFLYSENPNLKVRGNLPPIRDHPLAASNKEYLSYSRIDKEGKFRFEGVPRGNYFLKIHTSDRNNKIEIEPEAATLVVEDAPVVIENPFNINRFSVKGRVVDKDGNGIKEIRIALDGERKAITDNDGYYYIDKVPVGTYTLEGQHEHLFFDPISNLKLEPTITTLPDLVLSLLHLCGEVSLKDGINDNEFSNAKITVSLERPGLKRSAITDQNGHYCFEVQPDRYNVYPIITNIGNIKQESLLHPKSREVEIKNTPILDVNFYRPRLFINGAVEFLPNVKPSQIAKTRIILTPTNNRGTQRTVTLSAETKRFAFDQILPGTYKLYIENDLLCWKKDLQTIDLINSNLTELVFEQAGFAFKYHTSRALEVRIISPEGKPIDTQLFPSSSSYCVDKAGTYTIVPDICYQFATPEFNVSTDDEKGLSLDPIGYLVRGEVVANESIAKNSNEEFNLAQFIQENIIVSIQTESANPPKKNGIRLQYSKSEGGLLRFSYAYYVEPNSDIVIEARPRPKLPSQAEQIIQNLMFNPTKLRLHVGETCILDTQETLLEIRQGLIFVGSVHPVVNDWVLTVKYTGELPAGQSEIVESRQMTTSQFRLGPYIDVLEYTISAEKEGYKFEPTITEEGYNLFRLNFAAQKLSQLRIQVIDDARKPIPGALLFVSSMSKKNLLKFSNYTNERGVFSTHQLVKGDYLVRAVLKEYSFNPPQATISIEDGEHKEINIIAKRVAYSAFGRIQKLNKGGCAGLKIQAVPQAEGSVPTETAETDELGHYRLKGLVPGNKYTISVERSAQYSNIKPENFVIDAQESDLKNVDFLAFERKAAHTIVGNVRFDSTYTEEELDQIETIQVRLYKPGQEGHEEPLDIANLRLFRYFEFKNVKPQDYTVKVLIKRGKNQLPSEHTYEVTAASFGENPYVPADILISREKAKQVETSSKGSVVAPIVFLIVIFLVLNIDGISSKYRKYKEQSSTVNKKRT